MTSMVQTGLGPSVSSAAAAAAAAASSAAKYKDDSIEDSLRHPAHHAPQHPHHLHHPRSAGIIQHQKHPGSPHQPQPPTTIPSGSYTSHSLTNGLSHTTYGQSPQESPYYPSHPTYTAAGSAPGQYPSSGPPDLMATTAQMQRPYPPIYHTPQSSSPASVASQTHDHHGRNIYAQSPQMASQIYGYQPYSSMNPVQSSPYTHPSPQQHSLASQPLMMPPHQAAAAQISHQSPTAALPSPTGAAQQTTSAQRAILSPPHQASVPTTEVHHQSSSVGTSSSAAPGPIPATTPLVVRQDNNGVQWIAFEYSRDRVKMEYTIRCDVESVNVDNLSQEFKSENCVYPRACLNKDQYKGNRLVYETECNAVGWALADLNPSLRGKRGLIQRAVDSWRNSNQDPRLRSRRVRRMAKMNRRQSTIPAQVPAHMAGSPVTPTMPIPAGMTAPAAPGPRPGINPLTMGPPQLHHHHHAQPDGSPTHEEVSGTAEFTNASHHATATEGPRPPGQTATEMRPAQVFHGYPAFPPASTSTGARGPAMPPILRQGGLGALGRHPTVATSSSQLDEVEDIGDERHPSKDALFGPLTEGKRRKFILVDDNQRGCRVRVKVMLDDVNMDEIPDSYRMSNSVYPRTYFPVQMKSPPGRVAPGKRYFKDDDTVAGDDDAATVGRITVPAPSIDGESEVAVPKVSRKRHRKDVMLNDLSYRMSWSQSRVFAGRMLFLQRSLDAYRNKMRGTMLAAGREGSSIPGHFETRAGKRRFLERGKRRAAGSGLNASRRSAEEVEG